MTIAEREELIKTTVVRLQAIKTLEDFKASKEEITDLMERIFVSATEVLKHFFENIFSLSPDEKQSISESVQDDNFLLSSEIIKEFDRLEKIPDAKEFSEAFSAEMEVRMSPHLEEFTEQMGKLMETFMGGLVNGLAGAMGEAFGSGSHQYEEEDEIGYDDANPDHVYELYILYSFRTLEQLEEDKDSLTESLEAEIDYKLDELERLMQPGWEDFWDDDRKKIANMDKFCNRLVTEIEKECNRIAAKAETPDRVNEIRDVMTGRLSPKVGELKKKLEPKLKI